MQTVLLVQMEKMMQDEINEIELVTLQDDVIQLHDIARHIEKTIGKGQLSDDLRSLADKLSELVNRY